MCRHCCLRLRWFCRGRPAFSSSRSCLSATVYLTLEHQHDQRALPCASPSPSVHRRLRVGWLVGWVGTLLWRMLPLEAPLTLKKYFSSDVEPLEYNVMIATSLTYLSTRPRSNFICVSVIQSCSQAHCFSPGLSTSSSSPSPYNHVNLSQAHCFRWFASDSQPLRVFKCRWRGGWSNPWAWVTGCSWLGGRLARMVGRLSADDRR